VRKIAEINYYVEKIALSIIFWLTWLGLGEYMAGFILLVYIFSLSSKEKRKFLFRDKTIIVLLLLFTLSAVVSSLFAIDKLKSVLLSMLWFLVVYIPISYSQFSVNEDDDWFEKVILPVSFGLIFIILFYLYYHFFKNLFHGKVIFKRYVFPTLGKAATPDNLVMLTALGYGFLRERKKSLFLWIGLIFLIFSGFGISLTYDRGGMLSFFIISIILLSFDWKRLVVYLIIIAVIIYLTFHLKYFGGFRHLFDYLYLKSSQKALEHGQQLDTFNTAWLIIKDHWFLGVGTNNFSKYTRLYGSKHWYTYAHNFILQFWAENGLFGLIFGLSMLGVIFFRWLKSFKYYQYKYIALSVGVAFIGMLVGNLTNCTIWTIQVALPFWLLAGIINGIYFEDKNKKRKILYNRKEVM